MKLLGLPAETNPEVLGNVLRRIAEEGPHKAVAPVRQSALMELLTPELMRARWRLRSSAWLACRASRR